MQVQKWPQFAAAKKPFSNKRKDPKSLADFRRRNSKGLVQSNYSKSAPEFEKRLAKSLVTKFSSDILQGHSGEGLHILVPLTGALASGEFVSGLLKVLAPKVKVHFLVTPNHFALSKKSMETRQQNPELRIEHFSAIRNLSRHLDRCLRGNCERIVVLDDHHTGESYEVMKKLLERKKHTHSAKVEKYDNSFLTEFMGRFLRDSRNIGWKKDWLGKYALDEANFERMNASPEKYQRFYAQRRGQLLKETKTGRRVAYQLGIATAKEYLLANAKPN
ncbi:MAG: hypothetical protein WCW13_02090 [archaeon]|jgi:hypothetical protein